MTHRQRLVTLVLLAFPSSLVAQGDPQDRVWEGVVGMGGGLHLTCGDCDAEAVGFAGSAGLQRSLGPGLAVGVSWTGAWFDSDLGRLNRHLVHLDLLASKRSSFLSLFLRVGIGTAVATRVHVDRPADQSGPSDVVIAIGDTQGYGGLLGAGFRHALSQWLTLIPELRLSALRVEGATLTFAVALISVGIG